MLGWLWYQHWNMNSECMIPLSFKQWINMEDIDSSSVFWCFHLCHLNRQAFNCFWKRNLEQFAWISAAFIQITIEMGKSKWMQYSAEKPARTRNTNLPVVKNLWVYLYSMCFVSSASNDLVSYQGPVNVWKIHWLLRRPLKRNQKDSGPERSHFKTCLLCVPEISAY